MNTINQTDEFTDWLHDLKDQAAKGAIVSRIRRAQLGNSCFGKDLGDGVFEMKVDVAKARGMAKVAADAGLGRESLYKTLRPGSNPKFETVNKLMHTLGIKFAAVPDRKG